MNRYLKIPTVDLKYNIHKNNFNTAQIDLIFLIFILALMSSAGFRDHLLRIFLRP